MFYLIMLVIKLNEKKIFRLQADLSYGYLYHGLEMERFEEKLFKARRMFLKGIIESWRLYTEGNGIVEEANKTLDEEVEKAIRRYDNENSKFSKKQAKLLLKKAIIIIHDRYARTVAQTWNGFIRNMTKPTAKR